MISAAVRGRRRRRGREKVISLAMEVCKRKTQNARESMLRIFGGYMKGKIVKKGKSMLWGEEETVGYSITTSAPGGALEKDKYIIALRG